VLLDRHNKRVAMQRTSHRLQQRLRELKSLGAAAFVPARAQQSILNSFKHNVYPSSARAADASSRLKTPVQIDALRKSHSQHPGQPCAIRQQRRPGSAVVFGILWRPLASV